MKTQAALCAKSIKNELKLKFPSVKFSVKSDNFSMGNSVNIDWVDGPTTSEVDSIVKKYQYGHFNGMEDIYESSNRRDDIPQAKFVHTHRELSDDVKNKIWSEIQAQYSDCLDKNYNDHIDELGEYGYTLIWRKARKISFVGGGMYENKC